MAETVVLLHGLGRTRRSMKGLRRFIEGHGYETWSRTYPSRKMGVEELARTVGEWIVSDLGQQPVIGVTHSLGGILARHIGETVNWRGLVMLGPPNRGSRVAAALKPFPLYRWFFGPAGQEVADPSTWPPPPPTPVAVIAGTRGSSFDNVPSWLIASLKLIPEGQAHDGTVTVSETTLAEMSAYAEVPASHTWLMNHPQSRELVLQFLRDRSFGDKIP